MATEKQKANLEKNAGAFKRNTTEKQRKIASQGGKASGVAKRERKTMRQLAEICLNSNLKKPEIEAKLKEAGLPATYGGQMLFNAIQKAGFNSNMLRVVLELVGEIKQQQTNVNVTTTVNPYANLTEDELRKLAKGE